jgi:peptidyl-prolyl cis-trans isomerase D
MREYFRGLKFILIIVVVAFVATSVVYFGTGNTDANRNPAVVATVNGEQIPAERFRRAQANLVEQYERFSRQRLTPDMMERFGITQQVMTELVNDVMIEQVAAREGLRVGDDELRARIQQMKEFHEDGRFSRDRYLRLLRQVRLDVGEFETDMRRALTRRKVEELVKGGVKVSDQEVRDAWAARNERVRAAWASLDLGPLMASLTVDDADLEPYLKNHQAHFTRPERRRVQSVVLPAQPRVGEVSDADAETYFKEHPNEFEQPKKVHIAHVLVRVPPVGGSEAEAKSRAKIEDVLKRARAGEDFAKLAKEVSEDTANAQQGGDLGFVGAGELVPQFEQVAFSLKKGELSPAPVRTPFGYHAIKVIDDQEGGRPTYKEIAAKIKEKVAADRAETAARPKIEEARPRLQAAADFAAEARALGLEPREATINRNGVLPGVGRDPQVDEALFSLAVGGVSPALKTPQGWVVVKVADHKAAGVPPLAEIKPQVVEAIKRERAEGTAVERAKALIAAAGKGDDFLAAAKKDGFATGELALFSRAEPPKERGVPGGVMVAALGTAAGQLSEPVKPPAGVYVVKTLERQPPDPTAFDKQRDELQKQMLEQKRGQAWDAWVQTHRRASKIDTTNSPATVVVR